MIFIIFTENGLKTARTEIETGSESADLWLNPELLDHHIAKSLTAQGSQIHALPHSIDATDEKAVLMAISHVEKHNKDPDLFVEYL